MKNEQEVLEDIRQSRNRDEFLQACSRFARNPGTRSISIANDLVGYAQRSGCGCYSSLEIEQTLYALARDNRVISEPIGRPGVEVGHFLMVMSEAYATGGHTRVVERWVELDCGHRYSLIVTRSSKKHPLPERLAKAIAESGGKVVQLDADSDVCKRASELRALAGGFDKIILHIHTDDVIPLLAFGTEKFTRPVGLYNHADHLFWLGVGIADQVAELRKSKIDFSRRIRGVRNTSFVGIPMDAKEMVTPDRSVAKTKLGIAPDVPVIVTCGSATKYDPVLGMDFLAVARRVLEANPKAMLIGIGMTFKDLPAWKQANRELGGRIRVEGLVPFGRLYEYYDAADLYLDSYPVGGGTALPDALCRSCPILSLPSPDGKMDWIYDCGGYCETEDELVRRAGAILRGEENSLALVEREYKAFVENNSPAAFLCRLQVFLNALRPPHCVREFVPGFDDFSDLDRYHLAEHLRTDYLFGDAHSFIACYYRIDPIERSKWIRILGVRICIKRHKLFVEAEDV